MSVEDLLKGTGIGSLLGAPFAIGGGIWGGIQPGETGSPNLGAPMPTNTPGGDGFVRTPESQPANNAVSQRLSDIMQKINAGAAQGTYGEGAIANANTEMTKLRDDLKAGKISQGDFVKIGDAVVPTMQQYIMGLGGRGSQAANAMRSAGGETFMNDVGRDYNIYSAAQKTLGRDITDSELYQLRPKFADGADTGNAYLATLAEADKKNPANLGKQAMGFSGQINDLTQKLLSRGATPEEVDYFGRLMASGNTTPYQVQQFIEATPEYQGIQDKSFRGSLANELSGYDQKAFDQQKQNILSGFSKAGIQNSSALDFAMTDALSKLAANRGQFLGQLSAQQYQGNKQAALGDYQTSLNRLYNLQDQTTNRNNNMLDYYSQRADQGADYTRQMRDYTNFMNSQPQQSGPSWLPYLNAGLGVVNAGANLMGAFNPSKSTTNFNFATGQPVQ